MILIFIYNTCIIAPMDGNVVASETYYFTSKNCFDLNEPLQEGIIIIIYISFIIEYDVYILNSCFNITPMDDNVDASGTYQFVPMKSFDSNELSQEGIIIFILFVIYNSYII